MAFGSQTMTMTYNFLHDLEPACPSDLSAHSSPHRSPPGHAGISSVSGMHLMHLLLPQALCTYSSLCLEHPSQICSNGWFLLATEVSALIQLFRGGPFRTHKSHPLLTVTLCILSALWSQKHVWVSEMMLPPLSRAAENRAPAWHVHHHVPRTCHQAPHITGAHWITSKWGEEGREALYFRHRSLPLSPLSNPPSKRSGSWKI